MPAWEHEAKWNDSLAAEYGAFCQSASAKRPDRRYDCADLAIYYVVKFASSRGLPVILVGNRLHDSRQYTGSTDGFMRNAQRDVLAKHLPLPTNTKKVVECIRTSNSSTSL